MAWYLSDQKTFCNCRRDPQNVHIFHQTAFNSKPAWYGSSNRHVNCLFIISFRPTAKLDIKDNVENMPSRYKIQTEAKYRLNLSMDKLVIDLNNELNDLKSDTTRLAIW